jgi:biopolymer transport protein TolR
MSHAASAGSETCDPNLTPLLDLVLQILMFFMVTVNFATEQTQEDVALPTSQSARPLPKHGAKDPIFINLVVKEGDKNEHQVLITGKPPMIQAEARSWIQNQYDDLKRFGEVTSPVVIRADKNADYGEVYKLLRACADAGFRNLKVRAIVNN